MDIDDNCLAVDLGHGCFLFQKDIPQNLTLGDVPQGDTLPIGFENAPLKIILAKSMKISYTINYECKFIN